MMRRSALITAAAVPLLAGSAIGAPPLPPSPGLCRAGEQALFSCVAGAKAVAVCARGKFVQYRFGTPGRVELAYPARPGAGQLEWASQPYSGGGEAQIGFTRAGLRYVVYSRMVRTAFGPDGNDPEFSAGVLVLQEGKKLSERRCTRPHDADLDVTTAERLLPEGEFATVDE